MTTLAGPWGQILRLVPNPFVNSSSKRLMDTGLPKEDRNTLLWLRWWFYINLKCASASFASAHILSQCCEVRKEIDLPTPQSNPQSPTRSDPRAEPGICPKHYHMWPPKKKQIK